MDSKFNYTTLSFKFKQLIWNFYVLKKQLAIGKTTKVFTAGVKKVVSGWKFTIKPEAYLTVV